MAPRILASNGWRRATLALALLAHLASALPAHAAGATIVKRQDELLDEYDFIVVGAGTAGLTVGDRLSESGDYTVLVVEYGYVDESTSITRLTVPDRNAGPPDEYTAASRLYNLTSVPQPGLAGLSKGLMAGAVVGGSSAVNGMFFMRGSAEDYDAWVWTAGEKHQEEFAKEWGWKNILPAFRKSVTFHPPTPEMVRDYGITYDVEAAYGGNSSGIHSSYRPYVWAGASTLFLTTKAFPRVLTQQMQ